MLPLNIIAIFLLLFIILQDFKYREVSWLLIALLACTFILRSILCSSLKILLINSLQNLLFVLLQAVLLLLYYSLKGKIKDIKDSIGLGDIFLILSIIFAYTFSSFVIVYIGSLIFALCCWILKVSKNHSKLVPLAGYMSLFLIVIQVLDLFAPYFLSNIFKLFV
jgi:hypothetical protein